MNANLVVISPQLPLFLKDLKTKQNLDFEILHDSGNQTAAVFGIMMQLPDDLVVVYKKLGVDLARFNGDNLWRLPVPARFIIDGKGVVRAVEADPDYTPRPDFDVTLKALRGLPRPQAGAPLRHHRDADDDDHPGNGRPKVDQ
jgi:peroxiredoxin